MGAAATAAGRAVVTPITSVRAPTAAAVQSDAARHPRTGQWERGCGGGLGGALARLPRGFEMYSIEENAGAQPRKKDRGNAPSTS